MADNSVMDLDALLKSYEGNYTDNTMDWLRDMYGITATNRTEALEQLALLQTLGQGKSKGSQMLEGVKAGAGIGSDLGSKLAQLLPESKETLVAGPRGFGIVGRK